VFRIVIFYYIIEYDYYLTFTSIIYIHVYITYLE